MQDLTDVDSDDLVPVPMSRGNSAATAADPASMREEKNGLTQLAEKINETTWCMAKIEAVADEVHHCDTVEMRLEEEEEEEETKEPKDEEGQIEVESIKNLQQEIDKLLAPLATGDDQNSEEIVEFRFRVARSPSLASEVFVEYAIIESPAATKVEEGEDEAAAAATAEGCSPNGSGAKRERPRSGSESQVNNIWIKSTECEEA
jgi:hypothetical protein